MITWRTALDSWVVTSFSPRLHGVSRRSAFAAALVAALLAGCTSDDATEASERSAEPVEKVAGLSFLSRPDLTAPRIDVVRPVYSAGEQAPDPAEERLFFLGVKGDRSPLVAPLVVDADGQPVWIGEAGGNVYDVRVQTYRGEPVLTYWRGTVAEGYGEGEIVVLNTSYQEIATVTTTGGTGADFHETLLTDRGTALLVSYPLERRDLSGVVDAAGTAGPEDGYVLDSVVDEVDLQTGESLLRWSALDHVELADTYIEWGDEVTGAKQAPLDYFHVNSVTPDGTDGLLVSARNTQAVYRLDRRSGDIDWTLGGRRSDFEFAPGAAFAWQHDAQRQTDGTVTLFDNAAGEFVDDVQSRGLRLRLDEANGTAVMVEQLSATDGRLAPTQGNVQVLPDGSAVVGWGQHPSYSYYDADGRVLLDARIIGAQSYRVYLQPWTATPAEPPTIVVDDDESGRRAHLSWNGATEVAAWRILVGADAASARELVTVPRIGFETSVPVPAEEYVVAVALDDNGNELATALP